MNSHGFLRRIPKRRRTSKASQLLDLNLLPFEGAGYDGSPSSSEPVTRNQASGTVVAETPQLFAPAAAAGSHIGMNTFPIDVEAIDDDVVIYSSRRSLPQARQQSTRTGPITVIIDDDSETIAGPAEQSIPSHDFCYYGDGDRSDQVGITTSRRSGAFKGYNCGCHHSSRTSCRKGEALDEHVNTLLSLGMNPRHYRSRALNNSPVINLSDTPETSIVVAPPVPVKEVPKEPKFTCPVCMTELVNASSTICGHIFCQQCIRKSIQVQKKCPTCRRKLTMNNFHRVYLPTTE